MAMDKLSYQIIGAAMTVHNTLGPGHREFIYHQAMIRKLESLDSLIVESRPRLPVYDLDGVLLYTFEPDCRVSTAIQVQNGKRQQDTVLVDFKVAGHELTASNRRQMWSYLAFSAPGTVGLLINFGAARLRWKQVRYWRQDRWHASSQSRT